jgi:hypothetical protein
MYPQITFHKFPDFFVLCLDFATEEVRKRFLITKVSGAKKKKMFRGQHIARERWVERALIYNNIPEITGRNMYLPSGKLDSRTLFHWRPPTYEKELITSLPRKNQ